MSTRNVVVVTGGAGGMGLATAAIVGRESRVLIADVSPSRLERAVSQLHEQGVECEAEQCDVADRAAVDSLARRATTLGDVSAVVHTAGLSPHMADAAAILRVNAIGTVQVNQAFVRHARGELVIVNVASSGGHVPGPFPHPKRAYALAASDPDRALAKLVARTKPFPKHTRPGFAYAMSKHFVIWWSRHLAARFGGDGVRVISVSPGSIDTEMGRLEEAQGAGALAQRSALGRYGEVSEVGELLAFCASTRAGYLTGTDILIDGGAQAKMTARDLLAMAREGAARPRSGRA